MYHERSKEVNLLQIYLGLDPNGSTMTAYVMQHIEIFTNPVKDQAEANRSVERLQGTFPKSSLRIAWFI